MYLAGMGQLHLFQLQLQLQLHVKVLHIITQTPLLALLPASTCTSLNKEIQLSWFLVKQ